MPTKLTASDRRDRRGPDRRKTITADLPFPDRRQGERRSGQDRRSGPRAL